MRIEGLFPLTRTLERDRVGVFDCASDGTVPNEDSHTILIADRTLNVSGCYVDLRDEDSLYRDENSFPPGPMF